MQVIDAMKGFTFGCDPELFVLDPTGKAVSAEGLLPGTKEKPHPVPGGAIQVDGMAAEFNIEPAATFYEFDSNIKLVMKGLKSHLPKDYTLSAVPSMVFDEDVWDKAPEKAKELGCTPDFNAWTGNVNPPPNDPENPRLRTASGHLHVGWTEDAELSDLQHILNCRDLVKQFDWFLGGWSLKTDPDPIRRRLYGKAGACRFKPYGVEYRVLSNFWLTTPGRRLHVWNRMQTAIHRMRYGFLPDKGAAFNELLIQSINASERNALIERKYHFPLVSIEKKIDQE